ncbi:MAG: microtubule-binding protein [Bdellovibrionota bacterium]
MSTIFLLLYVVASLRTSTDAIKSQSDNQKLSIQVQELQNQLKMYESVKTQYMTEAPKDEQQEYQELMDKLTLLQEEAKSEKDRLAEEAQENGKKAQALNKYQQMIRNVLNANKVAKSRIITRNDIIGEQDVQIDDQKKDISVLQTDVNTKSQLIADGNRKIAEREDALKKKMQELKFAYNKNKMTKKAYEKQAKAIKDAADRSLAELKNRNVQYTQQLNQTNQKLNQLNSELQNTQATLSQKEQALGQTTAALGQTTAALGQTAAELSAKQAALAQKEGEVQGLQGAVQGLQGTVEGLQGKLSQAAGEADGLKKQMGDLQKGFAAKAAADKAGFDAEMGRLKLGAAERAAREGKFRADAERKAQALAGELQGLSGKLRDTEGALAKAKEEMDVRKSIAQEIGKSFQKAGVKADIDGQTGDVVLDFGNAYFDSDSANLKNEMRKVLEKAMPAYSSSLFGNPKIAGKISTVEIIGFASPTYKGKFVDPKSSKPEDRAALKYNMDLSYRRANSIFQYLLSDKNPQFQNQQDLIALTKVSGRSFLEVMKVQGRNLSTDAEFCRVNDCRKAQRVIIRFSMEGKK